LLAAGFENEWELTLSFGKKYDALVEEFAIIEAMMGRMRRRI